MRLTVTPLALSAVALLGCSSSGNGGAKATATARYQIRASNERPGPGILRASLCAVHEQLLYEAGDSGRVYAGTGVRYWLLDR